MRRRIRKEYTWQSSAWVQTNEVRYVYDMRLAIQERDANNLPLVTYTRGNDLSGTRQKAGGIGGILARTDQRLLAIGDSGAHAYYHCDGNGNVTALINTNGFIMARYEYDPFGNILSMSGPLAEANLYRFSSKEFHPNSGLAYYLYRYYDPNLQRWLNRDPIAERGGFNLFTSFNNDPTSQPDYWGHIALFDDIVIDPLAGAALALAGGILLYEAFHHNPFNSCGSTPHYPAFGPINAAPESLSMPMTMDMAKRGPRTKQGQGAEHLAGIEGAQEDATAIRPQIQGPDADPDWEGGQKRPEQNTATSKAKAEQRAKAENYEDCDD
jgi:RHS repeat-associated protein